MRSVFLWQKCDGSQFESQLIMTDFTFKLWWFVTLAACPHEAALKTDVYDPVLIHRITACCFTYLSFRLCGSTLKSTVITEHSNSMTVTFHSDSSYVDQGFTAEYEAFVPTNRKTDSF